MLLIRIILAFVFGALLIIWFIYPSFTSTIYDDVGDLIRTGVAHIMVASWQSPDHQIYALSLDLQKSFQK